MASKKKGGKIAASAAKRVAAAKKPAPAPARNPFGNRTSAAGVAANKAASAQALLGATKSAQLVAGKAAAARIEALSRGAIASDPKLQQEFQVDYEPFWTQLAKMTPAEREKILNDIKNEAKELVDPYYDEAGQYLELQKDIDRRSRELRKDDILKTAQTQFDRGVEDLTIQTGDTLSDVAAAAQRRGTADSGAERTLADKIIEAKMRGQGRSTEDLEYTKNLAQKEFDMGIESDSLSYRQKIAGLGRQRLFDTSIEESNIFSDLERFNYLNAGETATIPFYGESLNTPKPKAATTMQERVQARAAQRTGSLSSAPPSPLPRPPSTSSPRPTRVDPKKVSVNLSTRRYSFK